MSRRVIHASESTYVTGGSSSASPSSGTESRRPAKPGSKSKDDPPEEIEPLPILPRPLGVPDIPNAREKTWKETQADLMNQDKRMTKRKALIKEASQGYFHEYNALRNPASHGGKTWIAPPLLIREDKALYLPALKGVNLRRETKCTADLRREVAESHSEGSGGLAAMAGQDPEEAIVEHVEKRGLLNGRVALVSVLTTRLSEEHVNSFVQESLEDWEDDPQFVYVQINHQPNPLKSMLLQLFISSLRRAQKESRWDSYLIMGGEWGELAEPLGISNKHVGYTYLVDQNQKIRWAGCGYAEEEERSRLRRSVAVLMKRLKGESTETRASASASVGPE